MDVSFDDCVVSDHARAEMARRGISEELVRRLLAAPEQIAGVRPGRVVAQSRDLDPVAKARELVPERAKKLPWESVLRCADPAS